MSLGTAFVLLLVSYGLDFASGECRFGYNAGECTFRCRCLRNSQCNKDTGACVHGCNPYWMGPACQYGNIAYMREVTGPVENTLYNYITDAAEKNTCTSISSYDNPYVQIDLGSEFSVDRMILYNKDSATKPLNGTDIYVSSNATYEADHSCHSTRAMITKDVSEIQCDSVRIGRYITVLVPGGKQDMHLCGIEIYGGQDSAYGKPADQINTLTVYPAYGAVDGDIASISHTQSTSKAWWHVDLSEMHTITRIRIYHRQSWILRADGFQLSVHNGSQIKFSYNDTADGVVLTPIDIPVIPPVNGDRVQIALPGKDYLQLAEVEVYTDCRDGYFGIGCQSQCNCNASADICDKVNGACSSGCHPGYTGDDCLTDCENGTFGMNCTHICNCLEASEACDKNNGYCESGCRVGYEGEGCLQVCVGHRHGINCSSECTNCNNMGCNHTNGLCYSGCKPGYLGDFCDEECTNGTYGLNCSDICDNCKKTACHHESGFCKVGCIPGYSGAMCNTPDDDGGNGAVIGAVVGVILAILLVSAVLLFIFLRRRRKKSKEPPTPAHFPFENAIELGRKDSEEDVEDQDYENEDVDTPTRVPVVNLWNHVSSKSQNAFRHEFRGLPEGMVKPYESAKPHMEKNKYNGIYAYDHTRVILSPKNADGVDYMNANYIDGFHKRHEFIASQGTTEQNIDDFWLMIWQQNCSRIVMLTNLIERGRCIEQSKFDLRMLTANRFSQVDNLQNIQPEKIVGLEKCLIYWPAEGETRNFGSVEVTSQNEEDGKGRTIRQYHFTAWPDKDVPSYPSSMVQFYRKVKSSLTDDSYPIVVHCSAGIGRTGTFISLCYLVDQAKKENAVDVYHCVEKLREQRVDMIQTIGQYIFLHTVLVEVLHCKANSLSPDDFKKIYDDIKAVGGARVLEEEFKKLEEVYSGYKANFTVGEKPENLMKNRDQKIIPADDECPLLSTHISGCGEYINAVFLPGLRKKRQFIATQTPLDDTVIDFWRMIYEQNTKVIVDLSSNFGNVVVYPGKSDLTFGPITVSWTSMEVDETIDSTVQSLVVKYKEAHAVTVFQPKFWDLKGSKPPESIPLMKNLIREVNKCGQHGNNGGTVVMCPDGATRSGLFCVVFVSLERLLVEQEVGTGQIIKQYRSIRPQIIPDKEQLMFCYDVLMSDLNEQGTYSNFS